MCRGFWRRSWQAFERMCSDFLEARQIKFRLCVMWGRRNSGFECQETYEFGAIEDSLEIREQLMHYLLGSAQIPRKRLSNCIVYIRIFSKDNVKEETVRFRFQNWSTRLLPNISHKCFVFISRYAFKVRQEWCDTLQYPKTFWYYFGLVSTSFYIWID